MIINLHNMELHPNGTIKNFLPDGKVETLTLNEVHEDRLRPDERLSLNNLVNAAIGADLPLRRSGSVWPLFKNKELKL